MNIDWHELDRRHQDFKSQLSALSYNRKELVTEYDRAVKHRRDLGRTYKSSRKIVSTILLKIKKISQEIRDYREAWLEKGGTEENFWLHRKANEAMAEFKVLKEQKNDNPLSEVQRMRKEYGDANVIVLKAHKAIKHNDAAYRSIQRQMDENQIIRVVESFTENPTMDIDLFVDFRRIQLSIRKQRIYQTNVITGYVLAHGKWYLLDKEGEVDRECTQLEERFVEDAVNKYNK